MTNQYFLQRIAGRNPDLRAADADRERVADRLRKSHTEGRLDMAEFQERLERCYGAKTLGQLGELVSDLPRSDEPDTSGWLGRFLSRPGWLAPLALILIGLIVLSAAAGHHGHHVFWLWLPLLFVFWRMSWWRRSRWLAGTRRGSDDWI
jgi:hypothetical protein